MPLIINPFRVGFNPYDLDNLQYWYDASDFDTIIKSLGAVSEWKDKGPNGYHLLQPTGVNQPQTGTRKINTLDAIDFDGTSHYLQNPGACPSNVRSVFLVFHPDVNIDETTTPARIVISTASGEYSIGDGYGPATGAFLNEVLTAFDEDEPNVYVDRQGASNANLPDITIGDHFYSMVRQVSGSGDWFIGLDGSVDLRDLTSGTRHDWEFASCGTGLTIGASGRKGTPVEFFWDGLIGELIMFSDELTTAEREAVEGYLSHKWGI